MKDTYDDDSGSTIPGNIWADKRLLAIDTKPQKKKQCEQWQSENSNAINAYHSHVEAHGVFSDNVQDYRNGVIEALTDIVAMCALPTRLVLVGITSESYKHPRAMVVARTKRPS